MTDWQDMVVGDRMTVDNEFSSRVDNSPFSRQEWGLIMTATTFEIEHPDDEDRARIVANTSELRTMMPEVEKVANMSPMGPQEQQDSGGGGIIGSLLGALGLNGRGSSKTGGVDEEKLETAEMLVEAYAEELQAHLEAEGRWGEIRAAAASQSEPTEE